MIHNSALSVQQKKFIGIRGSVLRVFPEYPSIGLIWGLLLGISRAEPSNFTTLKTRGYFSACQRLWDCYRLKLFLDFWFLLCYCWMLVCCVEHPSVYRRACDRLKLVSSGCRSDSGQLKSRGGRALGTFHGVTQRSEYVCSAGDGWLNVVSSKSDVT